jgi:hypothetical protein
MRFLAHIRQIPYTDRSHGVTSKEGACIEMTHTNLRAVLGMMLGLVGALVIPMILQATEIEAIYYDRFDDPGSGWLEDEGDTGSVSYRNGKYQVLLTREYYLWWSWAPYDHIPDDFIVEISGSARGLSTGSNYGIIWGIDNDNFLLFTITPTGWFSVQSQLGGKWQTSPIDWKESRRVKQGEGITNTLRLTVEGDTVGVRINNSNAGTFKMGASSDLAVVTGTPTTVRLGTKDTWLVGLAAGSFDGAPVRIYFDEFALYELSSSSTDDRPTINIGGG